MSQSKLPKFEDLENTFGERFIENTKTDSDFVRVVLGVSKEISQRLRQFCGPFAAYSINPAKGLNNEIVSDYTKDGISIVDKYRTSNEVAETFLQQTRYVGQQVDKACSDGTTTSMMFFARTIYELLLQRQEVSGYIPLSVLSKACAQVIDDLEDDLKRYILTFDDLAAEVKESHPDWDDAKIQKAVFKSLAFYQAQISSKGDTELAECVAELVENCPKEFLGSYRVTQDKFESDKRLSVVTQEFDYTCAVGKVDTEILNADAYTSYRSSDARLIFIPSDFSLNDPVSDYVLDQIFDRTLLSNKDADTFVLREPFRDKPLVLICGGVHSGTPYELAKHNNLRNRENPVIVLPLVGQLKNTKFILNYYPSISGKYNTNDIGIAGIQGCTIDGVDIHITKSRLYVKNTYKRDGRDYHPYYYDDTLFPKYNEQLRELMEFIQDTQKLKLTDVTSNDLTNAISVYREMAQQVIRDLKIGATFHDAIALQSVAQDAVGAAMSTVEHGFILGGYPRLLFTCYARYQHESDSARKFALKVFADALAYVVQTIYLLNVDEADISADTIVPLLNEYEWGNHYLTVHPVWDSERDRIDIRTNYLDVNIEGFLNRDPDLTVLTQAYVGYREQFKRIRDVLPKLTNTTSYVVVSWRPPNASINH